MQPSRAKTFFFLGGPISGLLVALSAPPAEQRVLPWFALLPLFLSLDRHRERAGLRAAHGAALGAIVAAFGLGFDGFRPARFLESPILWAGIFALVSGPLLRTRLRGAGTLGLPSLWAGLGVLRELLADRLFPGSADLLGLGLAAVPGTPEASVARAVGAHGLSWLAALSAALFLAVFRETRPSRQLALVLAAAAVPLAAFAAGGAGGSGEGGEDRRVLVAVAAAETGDPESLLSMSRRVDVEGADLLVWPRLPIAGLATGGGDLVSAPEGLGRFLAEAGCSLVAAEAEERGGREEARIVVVGASGRVLFSARGGSRGRGAAGLGSFPGLVPVRDGIAAVADESALYAPAGARELVQGGAEIIAISSGARANRLEEARLGRLQSLRALETGRWIVRSGPASALAVDSSGRAALAVDGGVEGAGILEASLAAGLTTYARFGWLLEPALGAFAVVAIAAALIGTRRARRPAGNAPPNGTAGP